MLRAFLYGVGWAAISLAIQMWVWIAYQTIDPSTAVIVSVIAALVAVLVFQIAKRRPPNKSWSHAIYGWLWGFVTGIIAIYITVFIHFEWMQGLISPLPA
jgi:hypothetical protein